ncbi:MAG: hypothetical protein P8Y02_15495, partial [Deinococcales bacterium]
EADVEGDRQLTAAAHVDALQAVGGPSMGEATGPVKRTSGERAARTTLVTADARERRRLVMMPRVASIDQGGSCRHLKPWCKCAIW